MCASLSCVPLVCCVSPRPRRTGSVASSARAGPGGWTGRPASGEEHTVPRCGPVTGGTVAVEADASVADEGTGGVRREPLPGVDV